jgi:hypothetical protein
LTKDQAVAQMALARARIETEVMNRDAARNAATSQALAAGLAAAAASRPPPAPLPPPPSLPPRLSTTCTIVGNVTNCY